MIEVVEDISADERVKLRRSIIGKLCMDRYLGRDVLRTTMSKVWRTSKPGILKEVGKNLFTITFVTEMDKQREMGGRPWLFNNHLLVLKDLNGSSQPEAHSFASKCF